MQNQRPIDTIDVAATVVTDKPFDASAQPVPISRPTLEFMRRHVAHWVALGFGSGLARWAPGTMGTLWAWAVFWLLSHWLGAVQWAWVIGVSLPLGWWACTVTARHMGVKDPACVVWDEIAAFWLVLWLVMPTGFWAQLDAFLWFRFFDAVKLGPVRWADSLFKQVDMHKDRFAWSKAGLGIMLDDLVAAGCTLLLIALKKWLLGA